MRGDIASGFKPFMLWPPCGGPKHTNIRVNNVRCKVKSQQGSAKRGVCEGDSCHAGLRDGKCTEAELMRRSKKR